MIDLGGFHITLTAEERGGYNGKASKNKITQERGSSIIEISGTVMFYYWNQWHSDANTQDLFIYVWMDSCLHVCNYTTSISSAQEGQRRVSDLLGMELQVIVSCHMGIKSWTQILKKSSQCS